MKHYRSRYTTRCKACEQTIKEGTMVVLLKPDNWKIGHKRPAFAAPQALNTWIHKECYKTLLDLQAMARATYRDQKENGDV